MQIPSSLIQSLQEVAGFCEAAFIQCHTQLPYTSIRLNPLKVHMQAPLPSLSHSHAVPWCGQGWYLSERPSFTFHPPFHAGCYYVQEASSMFVEQALLQTTDITQPLRVLDVCAAPGGKSTHLQSLLSKESILVSNEVIRSRANILKDNCIKWGSDNVVVTHNDPKDFAKLPGFFDVLLIDAPCSGSGLFRRDATAINEWSENNVALCSERQQRIVADVLPALKENGLLIYATCSFSKKENEDVADWIAAEWNMESCALHIPAEWGITPTVTAKKNYGYRFWPHLVQGEGLFMAVFRKKSKAADNTVIKSKIKTLGNTERTIISRYAHVEQHQLVAFNHTLYAWPQWLHPVMSYLAERLKVIYSGVAVGQLVRDKLIPEHALAMSTLVHAGVATAPLSYEAAIAYLQRKNLAITTSQRGWQLACYNSYALGWVNVLNNRTNNYYPKELRIMKDKA